MSNKGKSSSTGSSNITTIDKILAAPDKLASQVDRGSAGGILASLLRVILSDLHTTPAIYKNLMDKYVARQQKLKLNSEPSSIRGTTNKELSAPAITWRTLVKFFQFIGVSRVTLTVKLTYPHGEETQHSVSFSTMTEADIIKAKEEHTRNMALRNHFQGKGEDSNEFNIT